MKDRYQQHITIPCYETDASQLLKPASFMDLAQEAANVHANILGFGYDDLMTTRLAWVLSRMHIRFMRHPKWREEVDLVTWHKGQERLFYLRDYLMKGTDGEVLVAATTSWLVLNIDTRRLVRAVDVATDEVCTDNAIEESCGKVQMPEGVEREHVCDHTVSYSDVDLNGHTNNAMYLVWAMDAVDYEVASVHPVKDVKVNFNHETKPGEAVSIFRCRKETEAGVVFYIEGEVDGRSAFCAELAF